MTKVRTNSGKQTIAFKATVLWENIPTHLRDLNVFNFSKQLKLYLLSEQRSFRFWSCFYSPFIVRYISSLFSSVSELYLNFNSTGDWLRKLSSYFGLQARIWYSFSILFYLLDLKCKYVPEQIKVLLLLLLLVPDLRVFRPGLITPTCTNTRGLSFFFLNNNNNKHSGSYQ